jgi:hypothetical protein
MMVRRPQFLGLVLVIAGIPAVSRAQCPHSIPAPPPDATRQLDPTFNPRGTALATAQTSLPLAADIGPEFVPSTADLVTVLAAIQNNNTTLTVGTAPFRLLGQSQDSERQNTKRWPWGVQVQAVYASDTKATTFAVGYRAEWRWLLERLHTDETCGEFERLKAAGLNGNYTARTRALDLVAINLMPVPTIGYQLGFFPGTTGAETEHAIASELLTAKVSWRYGTYVDLQATAAGGHKRISNTSGLASVFSASSALIYIWSRAFGLSHYDAGEVADTPAAFQQTVFQRGLGVGVVWSYQRCYEGSTTVGNCVNQLIKQTLVGGAIDLRISDKATPRFTVGRRDFATLNSRTHAIEVGLQLSTTVN